MSRQIQVIEPTEILEQEKATQLQQTIFALIEQGVDGVLVDLKQVSFINSSGLGVLVKTYSHLKKQEKELFLCSLNDQLRIVFELTSMDSCFKIFENREAFNEQIKATLDDLKIE